MHLVPLATESGLVLHAQFRIDEDRAAEDANDKVPEHRSMACPVPRLLFCKENIGRHNSVQVSPCTAVSLRLSRSKKRELTANDDANNDTALVNTLDIVARP